MPKLTDHAVITDNPFDLAVGQNRVFSSIRIPSDLVPGTGRRMAILQYKVRPLTTQGFSAATELSISVNGANIETVNITLDTVRGLWETFPATILNADSRANMIDFRAQIGPVRISDVILWFHRNI